MPIYGNSSLIFVGWHTYNVAGQNIGFLLKIIEEF